MADESKKAEVEKKKSKPAVTRKKTRTVASAAKADLPKEETKSEEPKKAPMGLMSIMTEDEGEAPKDAAVERGPSMKAEARQGEEGGARKTSSLSYLVLIIALFALLLSVINIFNSAGIKSFVEQSSSKQISERLSPLMSQVEALDSKTSSLDAKMQTLGGKTSTLDRKTAALAITMDEQTAALAETINARTELLNDKVKILGSKMAEAEKAEMSEKAARGMRELRKAFINFQEAKNLIKDESLAKQLLTIENEMQSALVSTATTRIEVKEVEAREAQDQKLIDAPLTTGEDKPLVSAVEQIEKIDIDAGGGVAAAGGEAWEEPWELEDGPLPGMETEEAPPAEPMKEEVVIKEEGEGEPVAGNEGDWEEPWELEDGPRPES